MRIEVALEWFLNPDHLPLIVGIQEGWFAEEGLEVSLRVPDDHYDGMASVTSGEVAFWSASWLDSISKRSLRFDQLNVNSLCS